MAPMADHLALDLCQQQEEAAGAQQALNLRHQVALDQVGILTFLANLVLLELTAQHMPIGHQVGRLTGAAAGRVARKETHQETVGHTGAEEAQKETALVERPEVRQSRSLVYRLERLFPTL